MNQGENDNSNEIAPREIGLFLSVFSIAALAIWVSAILMGDGSGDFFELLVGVPFFLCFSIPLSVVSLIILLCSNKDNRLLHVHIIALQVPYILLMLWFCIYAPGEARKDAQGALIYLFGPIYTQIAALAIFAVFCVLYYIIRRVRKK